MASDCSSTLQHHKFLLQGHFAGRKLLPEHLILLDIAFDGTVHDAPRTLTLECP